MAGVLRNMAAIGALEASGGGGGGGGGVTGLKVYIMNVTVTQYDAVLDFDMTYQQLFDLCMSNVVIVHYLDEYLDQGTTNIVCVDFLSVAYAVDESTYYFSLEIGGIRTTVSAGNMSQPAQITIVGQ